MDPCVQDSPRKTIDQLIWVRVEGLLVGCARLRLKDRA